MLYIRDELRRLLYYIVLKDSASHANATTRGPLALLIIGNNNNYYRVLRTYREYKCTEHDWKNSECHGL